MSVRSDRAFGEFKRVEAVAGNEATRIGDQGDLCQRRAYRRPGGGHRSNRRHDLCRRHLHGLDSEPVGIDNAGVISRGLIWKNGQPYGNGDKNEE